VEDTKANTPTGPLSAADPSTCIFFTVELATPYLVADEELGGLTVAVVTKLPLEVIIGVILVPSRSYCLISTVRA
jgi:hypothetical protein